jgi:hypothetical protein
VIVDHWGPDAGVDAGGSRLTGANGQQVRIPTVTHCVWRSTRYPPIWRDRGGTCLVHWATPEWMICIE